MGTGSSVNSMLERLDLVLQIARVQPEHLEQLADLANLGLKILAELGMRHALGPPGRRTHHLRLLLLLLGQPDRLAELAA